MSRQHRSNSHRFFPHTEEIPALAQVGNGFPPLKDWKQPAALDNEQLASFVASAAVEIAGFCEALKPYYLKLRWRFHSKPKETLIHGCRTWNEYCEKALVRTRRAINYWLAGGNPNEKRKSRQNGTTKQGSEKAPAPENDDVYRPTLTQRLTTIPTTETEDWTDNVYVKTCVDFFASTLQPLESDPDRFHRVAMTIAHEILGYAGTPEENIVAVESELAAVKE